VQARTAAHFPWRNTVEPQHGVWWVTDGPPVRGFFAWGYGGQFVLRRARSGSRRGGRDRMVVPRYCRSGDGGQRVGGDCEWRVVGSGPCFIEAADLMSTTGVPSMASIGPMLTPCETAESPV